MISSLTKRLQSYRTHRRTILELSQMDDRMLSDIGVMRGDIDRMVRVGR
ncbi:DUF1127 domain-containing protein [Aureimonas sp. ME7]|nr:DUF1127 domain-containing protein [Aureimonas sp. ME7]